MRSPLAVSTSGVLLLAVGILSVVLLAVILVAPWKRVRDEPPLDKDVEARLLLNRPDPEEPTGEVPTARVSDLSDHLERTSTDADFTELRDLDE